VDVYRKNVRTLNRQQSVQIALRMNAVVGLQY